MLKRLIEVALPLKEVSEQSAREKSIRHGHISTLHIWWARRPLAACRAAVFASLIPDPDDPECPEDFRKLVMETLKRSEFTPKNGNGSVIEDTARNRCLEFIKYLVQWENSNNDEYIGPAKKLIVAAHKYLHPGAEGDVPKVLDPFSGGGAIPLEAIRLGCEAHAVDLNPVAHVIELCTLVYPQKYGRPDSRPVPDYIKRLIAHNRPKKKQEGNDRPLLDPKAPHPDQAMQADDEITPDVEITESEYRKNPLAADVKYWGHWVMEATNRKLHSFYPVDPDAAVPVAFLWARTVKCPNPSCSATVPLVRQFWLCKKAKRKVALRMDADGQMKQCRFTIAEGRDIDFDPDKGTMQRGNVECPFCRQVAPVKYLRQECRAGRMGQQLMAVVSVKPSAKGKAYRAARAEDAEAFACAERALQDLSSGEDAADVPTEQIQLYDPRRVSPPLYGLNRFADLFNRRQLLVMATMIKAARSAFSTLEQAQDGDYAKAILCLLAMPIDWFADKESSLVRWHTSGEKISGTFGRQALGMVWDYAEVNPFSKVSGGFLAGLDWTIRVIKGVCGISAQAIVRQGSATALPLPAEMLDAVVTDPPYYDAVPYSILSDFFYVWLKRLVGKVHPDLFRTPSTPKKQEAIEQRSHKLLKHRKDKAYYEETMANAFRESRRVLTPDGICCVMFAHKATSAWESLICGLLQSGLVVTASWPLHTEMKTRMVARGTAALAGSVTMVCRTRAEDAGDGLWDDVRQELREVAHERLDFFWSQGIRGADFFISAIGPALSVFGKYKRVTKLSGEEVTVGQFLDEVRGLVTNYALAKILKTTQTANIDPESRFYVIWKWSYADGKVPADESFKLAQALGMATETMWDRTGVLEKSGENVQALPIAKRMKTKDVGEPNADGSPGSLIDVLHRLCVFREKNDTDGMAQFLARSGQGSNSALWVVAQAIGDILPDGDKEKQLMQGLLNQKEKLEQAAEQGRLF
jgi:adenine-specific DNA methylase